MSAWEARIPWNALPACGQFGSAATPTLRHCVLDKSHRQPTALFCVGGPVDHDSCFWALPETHGGQGPGWVSVLLLERFASLVPLPPCAHHLGRPFCRFLWAVSGTRNEIADGDLRQSSKSAKQLQGFSPSRARQLLQQADSDESARRARAGSRRRSVRCVDASRVGHNSQTGTEAGSWLQLEGLPNRDADYC